MISKVAMGTQEARWRAHSLRHAHGPTQQRLHTHLAVSMFTT